MLNWFGRNQNKDRTPLVRKEYNIYSKDDLKTSISSIEEQIYKHNPLISHFAKSYRNNQYSSTRFSSKIKPPTFSSISCKNAGVRLIRIMKIKNH